MNRGDVYWYIGPATPVEPNKKRRPVVIVSQDNANQNPYYPYVTVVPITSNVSVIDYLEVDLDDFLAKPSKAQPQIVYTCRKSHLSQDAITALPDRILQLIGNRLNLHLDLKSGL